MAGVPASGAGPGDLKSNSVVCERFLGAARSIDRAIFPSNGDVTQTKRHSENPGRFTSQELATSRVPPTETTPLSIRIVLTRWLRRFEPALPRR